MRNQFTVFDVETANRNPASICSIGIVVVADNVVIDEYYSLVNPNSYFDSGNIAIHGIQSRDVADAPSFQELWPTIRTYFDNQLVLAHFASFDIGALRGALKQYHLDEPIFSYSCTCILGRKVLPESHNHKLNTLAHYYGLTFQHHNALEDARVAALIAIRYLESHGLDDMDGLHKQLGVKYRSFVSTPPKTSKIPVPKPIFTKANESHLLYRKHVCITGTLKEERNLIYHRLALVGAYIDEQVTVATDFLVSGEQNTRRIASTKLKTALKLQDVSQIQIIDEDLFYTLLRHQSETRESSQIKQEPLNYVQTIRKLVGSQPLLITGATILHFNDSHQILLQLRSDTNTWGLPGGAMEPKETIEDCAKREFLEETGMQVHSLKLIKVFSGEDFYFKYPNGDEVYSVCVVFLADSISNTAGMPDHETKALRYFDLHGLPNLESRAKIICDWVNENKQVLNE